MAARRYRQSAPKRRNSSQKLNTATEPTEDQIHIALVHHLKARAAKGVLFWHTPNGGKRSKSEAAKFAAMGTKSGIPDLLFMAGGRMFALELKRSKGRLSSDQRDMLAAMDQAGAVTATAYGLDAAIAILEAWGILRAARFPEKANQFALPLAA